MTSPFIHRVRVEFSDTDAAGVAHFTRLLGFAEAAEHAFMRELGVDVMSRPGEPMAGWPRVDIQFQFLSPLRFGDEVDIDVTVIDLTEKSVSYGIKMTSSGGRVVCIGQMTNVRVVTGDDFQMISSRISDDDRELFLNELEKSNALSGDEF